MVKLSSLLLVFLAPSLLVTNSGLSPRFIVLFFFSLNLSFSISFFLSLQSPPPPHSFSSSFFFLSLSHPLPSPSPHSILFLSLDINLLSLPLHSSHYFHFLRSFFASLHSTLSACPFLFPPLLASPPFLFSVTARALLSPPPPLSLSLSLSLPLSLSLCMLASLPSSYTLLALYLYIITAPPFVSSINTPLPN